MNFSAQLKKHLLTLELNNETMITKKIIRKQYLKLSKKYHPDINKTSNTDKKMKEINFSYDWLMTNYDLVKKHLENKSFFEENIIKFSNVETMDDYLKRQENEARVKYQKMERERIKRENEAREKQQKMEIKRIKRKQEERKKRKEELYKKTTGFFKNILLFFKSTRGIIIIGILLPMITLIVILKTIIYPKINYNKGLSYIENKDFKQAETSFRNSKKYKNGLQIAKILSGVNSLNYFFEHTKDNIDMIISSGGTIYFSYDNVGQYQINPTKNHYVNKPYENMDKNFYMWSVKDTNIIILEDYIEVYITLQAHYTEYKVDFFYNEKKIKFGSYP